MWNSTCSHQQFCQCYQFYCCTFTSKMSSPFWSPAGRFQPWVSLSITEIDKAQKVNDRRKYSIIECFVKSVTLLQGASFEKSQKIMDLPFSSYSLHFSNGTPCTLKDLYSRTIRSVPFCKDISQILSIYLDPIVFGSCFHCVKIERFQIFWLVQCTTEKLPFWQFYV